MKSKKSYSAVSLFTCAGLGDIGLQASGARFITMNELESDRARIAQANFPKTKVIIASVEDVKKVFSEHTKSVLKKSREELFLASCTAPCQGMSSAGMGKLLDEVKRGNRPKLDPRNGLIIPALEIIKELHPRWIIFENVTAMRRTLIEHKGKLMTILEVIRSILGKEYQGEAYDVEFADYGVPQTRKRLITVYTRDPKGIELLQMGGQLIPAATHSKTGGSGFKKWISVKEALHHFPSLDAKSASQAVSKLHHHNVAVLDKKKYFWVSNTPPGACAFDNQCVNPSCGFAGNTAHTTSRGHDGVNRSSKQTPIYCEQCGEQLPRPYAEDPDGTIRIMRGFTSAYRRMKANTPAPTISRNFTFVCGDQKIHYSQNRPLSVAEALHLQTVDKYPFQWTLASIDSKEEKIASPSLIRLCIAESIPPFFMELLGKHLRLISGSKDARSLVYGQMHLTP
jgi:DNA (cytosine-5)-methyltransferase 1